jgi:radical SAM superfamily enzyme YgiQ (UPF0313 family)
MKKVLFTTAYKPFPALDGVNSMDLYASRLNKGQDIFALKSYYPALPLFLIAQNISLPAVVLEHPTLGQFQKELKNDYDYIGIHFAASLSFDKVLTMCRLIRRLSPKSKIILGGYGVSCLSENFAEEKELEGMVDYVCRTEGVRFTREVVGDPPDGPIKQDLPSAFISFMGEKFYFDNVISALGCRAGCEFCATSAFFKYQKIRLATPAELWRQMKKNVLAKKGEFTWVYDEDFFQDPDYVREFGRLIKNDNDVGLKDLSWGGYGSIRTLSRFEPEELADIGLTSLWIGVESKFSDLPKRQGKDIKEFFHALSDVGIQTVGSFIVGWDFHTRENIKEDVEYLAELNPTFSQISSLMPCPGTKLWKRVAEANRLNAKDFKWKNFHLYSHIHTHDKLSGEDIDRLVRYTNQTLYEENGPSLFRMFEVHLKGYKRFKNAAAPRLRERAEFHRKWCLKAYPILLAVKTHTSGNKVAAKVNKISREYQAEFGRPSPGICFQSVIFLVLTTCLKLGRFLPQRIPQPKFGKHFYHNAS